MRTKDGKTIEIYSRFSYEDVENLRKIKMHVYEHDNLLTFFDGSSASENLYCENGWYGFKNENTITDKNAENNKEHMFSHTINNDEGNEFVDMFPDRTRYSFIPKYNEFKHRYEKNWDVFLTYPWKNFYNHNLVNNVKTLNDWENNGDKQTFALSTFSIERTKTSTNRKTMLFRTFCKHNLSVNDKIVAYLSNDYGETYKRLPGEYTVDYVGDINGDNREYFFGISAKLFLNDVFAGKIENLFYEDVTRTTTPPITVVYLSEGINDVPDVYNGLEIIRVFSYVQQRAVQPEYSDDETFDTLPKTINQYSKMDIRVWDGTFTYYEWVSNEDDYMETAINPQVEYGEWNTYTDKPGQQEGNYIRVKNYSFYEKTQTDYKMKTDINDDIDIDAIINKQFKEEGWHIRFNKVVSNVECKYYIRQFRKIPNMKYSSEPLTEDVSRNETRFLGFLEKNAMDDNGTMLSFDSETYNLAFSKTLYNDDIAQVTFLDTVNIESLTDNLGRPVTEIYTTIVKRNKGYKEWYNVGRTDEIDLSETEYSRCFGSLTSGLEFLDLDNVYDLSSEARETKGMMSSIGSIYRDRQDESLSKPMTLEDWDETNEEKEITETDDVFYGDVVEYNPIKCQETTLADVCFRFNTAQREVGQDENDYKPCVFNFTYHELKYDDFDPLGDNNTEPFLLTEYRQWNDDDSDSYTDMKIETASQSDDNIVKIHRHEGYFYKPHTKIQLLRYTDKVFQGSHRTLHIKDCSPMQSDGIYIKVTTQTLHGVGGGTVIYVCKGNEWLKTTVSYIIDKYRFVLSPIAKNDELRQGMGYADWIEICKGVLNGDIKLRVHNEEIPVYADKVDENIFLWREIINPNSLSDNDPLKHPFSNDSFYVDSQVNLYLRRQDPNAINGLYYSGNISDIQGRIYIDKNNSYKDVGGFTC